MTSREIESALSLTPAQSLVLNRLICISPFSGGGGFILKEGDPWWTDLPQDVVNYPRTGDLRAFFESRVMENYNPAVPIEENSRTVFFSKNQLRSRKLPRQGDSGTGEWAAADAVAPASLARAAQRKDGQG